MNRRRFLQCAAAAATASLARPTLAAPVASTSAVAREAAECDVLVVGAGPSGIPAAIAAARQGAKVILCEQDMTPGGAPVNMLVSMLCGGPRVGIYREMAERLNAGFDLQGRVESDFNSGEKGGCNYWYLPSSFAQVAWAMIAAEKNIKLICGARAIGAIVDEGSPNRVRGALFERGDGKPWPVRAKVTIEATGTGLFAELAGCRTMYGREARSQFNEPFGPDTPDTKVQRCTWMYISQRLRPDAVLPREKIKGGGMVEHRVDHWVGVMWKGKLDDYQSRNAGIYLHWGANLHCKDTRDPVELANTAREGLAIMEPDLAALREAGFVVHLAPRLGVREVRRVVGEYVLSANDLKSGKLPEDTVALTDGGFDVHQTPPLKPEEVAMPRGGIPYRALIAKDAEGLLVAGKSFSCTHYALGASRVQPVVASIGTAAGVAAAMAAKNDSSVRAVDVKQIQEQLRPLGVV